MIWFGHVKQLDGGWIKKNDEMYVSQIYYSNQKEKKTLRHQFSNKKITSSESSSTNIDQYNINYEWYKI